MSHKLKVGDRVAYSAKFLRSVADYSHRSASMRGAVLDLRPLPHSANQLVGVKWDNDNDGLRAGALSCNLVSVAQLASEAAM
jgi:hypothetical protein